MRLYYVVAAQATQVVLPGYSSGRQQERPVTLAVSLNCAHLTLLLQVGVVQFSGRTQVELPLSIVTGDSCSSVLKRVVRPCSCKERSIMWTIYMHRPRRALSLL